MPLTLLQKQKIFAQLVSKLIREAVSRGYEITFGEAYRTPEQAALNAAKGIGIKNSLHTQRLAIDLNLFKENAFLVTTKDHQPLGEWWEAQSTDEYQCAWGGRFGDANHYSIAHEGRK